MRALLLYHFIINSLLFTLSGYATADLVITEFMARNSTGIQDADGETSDWIELWNDSNETIALEGYALTDSKKDLTKWLLPPGSLSPGERRLIFASAKNRREPDAEWHCNFRLSASGDYLALVAPDGKTLRSEFEAAPQFTDWSFGLSAAGKAGYLEAPTPGAPNGQLVFPGPVISDVSYFPETVMAGDDVTITARILPRDTMPTEVILTHRPMYKSESTVAMNDDGVKGDAIAGDSIYTAIVPGKTLFGTRLKPGEMMRWKILATDEAGLINRWPIFLDNEGTDQSPEYDGLVIASPDRTPTIPLLEWFTEDETNSRTRTGARASMAYAGRFYDNIYVRQRGGATNGQSQKFNFNDSFPVYVNEELPAVKELNLNAQGSDTSYIRQPLAFETFRKAGNGACESFLVQMTLNGLDDRTGVLIEQVDDDFLVRSGYDPEGELYKMVQRANLDPVFADVTTGVEKKTGDVLDLSSLQSLVDGLKLTGDDLTKFLLDNIDLPQVLNYLAVRSVIQDADDVRKNFYVYFDRFGTREWSMFPWDKDWTFGVTGDGGPNLTHPFFGDQAHLKTNANQWNRLYNALFGDPTTREMYLRRLRTLMDTFLQPETTPEQERYFENRIDAMIAAAKDHISPSGGNSVKSYFPGRRRDLYQTYQSLVPDTQSADLNVAFDAIEFNPTSGNQDEEYIQLRNQSKKAIDMSGWTLEGGVRFTFKPGTVLPTAGTIFAPRSTTLYISPNVTAFRARQESPKAGELHFVQGPYEGHLSNRGESLILKDAEGNIIAETAYEGNPSDVERYLAVSEVMYHPAVDNTEFIEIVNLSATITLDLTGLHFTDGIDFTIPDGDSLAPGARAVIVQNESAFRSLYGNDPIVLGSFANLTNLSNGGELVKMEDSSNNTVIEFRYNDNEPWPADADGGGRSLIVVNPAAYPNLNDPSTWQASAAVNGTPGAEDVGVEPPARAEAPLEIAGSLGELIIKSESNTRLERSSDLKAWSDARDWFDRTSENGRDIWTPKVALPGQFYLRGELPSDE